MVNHVLPANGEAMPFVTISTDNGGRTWLAEYQGKTLVSGSRVPSCDVCRALLAMGITGKVNFRHRGSDSVAFTMDIEKAAKLTVSENDQGIKVSGYVPFPVRVRSGTAFAALACTDIPETHNAILEAAA